MHIPQTVTSKIDGTLKAPHEHAANNAGDNIITITAASINECSASNDAEQLKSYKSNSPNPTTNDQKGAVHAITASSTDAATSTRTRQHFRCCKLARCISFQDNIADVHHRKGRRLNGLQLPLHPLQVFGWLVLILFGIASYYVLIPSFTHEIQGPLYGLISGLYIVHVASHLAALLIDPADRELRRVHRNDRIVPEFDRSKHTHVIENGRCHLCNIRTSSARTKHCSVCNKCVGKFDHHCKWLNHCIGSRNYVAFLMCVVSAVIATLVIVAAVIAQIVLYYVQPEWLNFWFAKSGLLNASVSVNGGETLNASLNVSYANVTFDASNNVTETFDFTLNATNATGLLIEDELYAQNATLSTLIGNLSTLLPANINDTLAANLSTTPTALETQTAASTVASSNATIAALAGIGTSDTIFLILIGFLGLLAAITAGLLLHLCFFHIYISFLGLTTYEYIRNHRQAQEAKAKNMLTALPKNTQHGQHFSTHPSKKTNECGQIYCCSSVRHPNANDPTDRRYFDARKPPSPRADEAHQTKLHCCANSREYHQTALKTYYMCSLLEEDDVAGAPLSIAHISGRDELYENHVAEPIDAPASRFKTFHCCSTFGASATQRKVSAAASKATLVTDLEALSARRSYMQYTEQCTFCTFRIRSPIVAKRASATSTRTVSRKMQGALGGESKPSSAASKVSSAEHQRCCMKAISKHQRWRRKWNCCSSVPDSPDVPNDIIAALTVRHQQAAAATSAGKKINATEIPVHFIKTVNGDAHTLSPRSAASLKSQTRTQNARTWPMPRLRHMMRMLNRYRRPRCRHSGVGSGGGGGIGIAAEQIKQNQIRPLQLHSHANGCGHHHYYDSSSPQPPSSTTTASERSSDSSNLTTPSGVQPNTIETILPTSVIRDDTCMTYTTPMGFSLPPALPPPTRRKIPNPTDLEELAETLGFVTSHASSGGGVTLSPVQRLPALNNVYRRQRRKHFMRTRSPTLSPIHETGLSNPTSPQPCRHNASTAVAAVASSSSSLTAAVNNLCSTASELARKTSSNSSLHSISSNSSSN